MRAMIPNSTQIPDVILDHWMAELSGAEFKVLMYIARRTYGFGKHEDAISLKQIVGGIVKRDGTRLDRGTGLNKDTVCKALTTLEARGIVLREQRADETYGDLPNSYSLNLAMPELDPERGTLPPVSENPTRPAGKSSPRPVGKSDTGGGSGKRTGGVSENPTGGGSDKTTGGSRKIRTTPVGKSDTQETDQETVVQETATTARGEDRVQEAAVAAAAQSPSALGENAPGQAVSLLVHAGFSRRDAETIAAAHPEEAVRSQIEWLDLRSVKKNRLGMLRRAIEEGWPKPENATATKAEATTEARKANESAQDARKREILDGLRAMYSRLPEDAPEAYAAFLGDIEERKGREATRPLIRQNPKRLQLMLRSYDHEERRLALMVEFFEGREAPIPEFEPLLSNLKNHRFPPIEELLRSATP